MGLLLKGSGVLKLANLLHIDCGEGESPTLQPAGEIPERVPLLIVGLLEDSP